MPDSLEQEITALVAEVLELDPASLSLDGDMWRMYELDSVAMLEILVTLERRYGVRIQEQDINGLATLGQVIELIRRKRSGNG